MVEQAQERIAAQEDAVSSGTAPRRRVAVMQYEPAHGLPRVVLKGTGGDAERILSRRISARPAAIRDPALVESLHRLPMDAEIGPELFRVVAAILAHVYALDAVRGEGTL